MADKMTPQQRHRCMSRIRSKDTRPELQVRRFLWHNGFRYRLHIRQLPGCPDIVIRRLHTAIFINGCFWHGHTCMHHLPASNRKFWYDKITRNKERDIRNIQLLEASGWVVITIWECQLKKAIASDTLQRLLNTLQLLSNSAPSTISHNYVTASDDDDNEYSLAAEDIVPYTGSNSD